MQGFVEKKYTNYTNRGKPWWSLVINGERYSTFSESVASQCVEGQSIDFEWGPDKSGQYKNLLSANGVSAGQGGPRPQQQQWTPPSPPPTRRPAIADPNALAQAVTDGCKLIADAILFGKSAATDTAREVFPGGTVTTGPETTTGEECPNTGEGGPNE
jgi:hypothetical protein